MNKPIYKIYFVSESTAITAEKLGSSLLTQFPETTFERQRAPFINTSERAQALIDEIELTRINEQQYALVFATMPDPVINQMFEQANCLYYELFNVLIEKIEQDTGLQSVRSSGLTHGQIDLQSYDQHIDIMNYTLSHDDAISLKQLDLADVILIGISRSGKTPICIYLAMQFGIRAANYPLTAEDFNNAILPSALLEQKQKLMGLTILPARLAEIRQKRSPGSHYAAIQNCQQEIRKAQQLFQHYQIPVLDSTTSSVEELASRILMLKKLPI